MADAADTTQSDSQTPGFDDSMPVGGHALEVAARAGFGPLSPLGEEVWHGQSVPCVSCGQLVRRVDSTCEHCGQDLSEDMIQKMRQHAGPWFVLEHVRPFPGVSLERVIRQIRRGLITETSIVRGPSNDYQWRFAVETPGLCRYFGKCWCCHASVTLSDTYCPHCLHYLSFEKPRPGAQIPGSAAAEVSTVAPASTSTPAIPAQPIPVHHVTQAVAMGAPSRLPEPARSPAPPQSGMKFQVSNLPPQAQPPAQASVPTANRPSPAAGSPQSPDLARLSAAVRQARVAHRDSEWDAPPRVGGVNVAWFAAIIIVGAIVALLLISRARSVPATTTSPSLPTMTAPANPPAPVGHVPAAPTSLAPTTASPSTPPSHSPSAQPAPAPAGQPPPSTSLSP